MKHPQLNFRQPAVDRFIEVMTTAKIFLDPDIRGDILQNIDEYKYLAAKLQSRVYEMLEDVRDKTNFTFLCNPAPVDANFCIKFDNAYFKINMFNPTKLESIDIIAARIIRAKNISYPEKKKKESLPLDKIAQNNIKSATEKDLETIKDVTDCLILGTAIALLDNSTTIKSHHITEAINYKLTCKI